MAIANGNFYQIIRRLTVATCYHDWDFVFVNNCEQLLETVCLIVEPGQLIMHQTANSVVTIHNELNSSKVSPGCDAGLTI